MDILFEPQYIKIVKKIIFKFNFTFLPNLMFYRIYYLFLPPLVSVPSEINHALIAIASIMSCCPNGFDIIEYTKYIVQINNIPSMIPRKILLFLNT